MNTYDPIVRAVQIAVGVKADADPREITWRAVYKAITGKEWKEPEATTPAKPVPPVTSGDRVDARSETAIQTLHPTVQPYARELVRKAAESGIIIKVTSGTRTYDERNALYEQGRSKPGSIVTNARGGYSNHNFGIAFDVTIFESDKPVWESPKYKTVGHLGEALGLEWGGRWTSIQDEPHFELKPEWASLLGESDMLSHLRERKSQGKDMFA